MLKKEERRKKKGVSRRRADIRRKQRAAFLSIQPSLVIEIPLDDGKPPSPYLDTPILVSVQWPDNGVRRSQSIKLPERVRIQFAALVKATFTDLCGDELHSRISREYRAAGFGSARNIAFGRCGREKGEKS